MAATGSAVCIPADESPAASAREDSGGERGACASHRADHSYNHVVPDITTSGEQLRRTANETNAATTTLRSGSPAPFRDALGAVGDPGTDF